MHMCLQDSSACGLRQSCIESCACVARSRGKVYRAGAALSKMLFITCFKVSQPGSPERHSGEANPWLPSQGHMPSPLCPHMATAQLPKGCPTPNLHNASILIIASGVTHAFLSVCVSSQVKLPSLAYAPLCQHAAN